MRPQASPAREAFQAAAEARRKDLHNPRRAAELVAARAALDEQLAAVLARLPYRTRRVGDLRPGRDGGHVHLAVAGAIQIGGWSRARSQTVCGALPGRYAADRPVTCRECLRLADQHVDLEPNPPELPLG